MATKKQSVPIGVMPELDWSRAQFVPDAQDAQVPQSEAQSAKSRSIPAAINDTVIDFSNAVAGGAGSIANFVSPGNRFSKFIDEGIVAPGRANQSDATRAEDARYAQEMEAAQGVGDEVASTLGYVARNPIRSLATAAGSFVGPAAGIKAAQLAARGVGVAAGGVGAARAGMAGGALTGAALAGGDAGGTAYELVMKAGGTPEQATEAARNASVIPAVIGGIGGVVGAERLMAGAKGFTGGRAAQVLKTGAVEAGQEAIEEGVTQYEGRRAAMPYDPTIDPMKGVAGAATMGAALGAATGGALAALKPTVPEIGPLSRAANIAPAPVDPPAPPPPVPLTPEQEATLKAHANARNAELTEKAKGTKDVKTPDGTTPGKQPEFLTPAEKEEQAFLQENGGDTQALAKAYPGLTAEQEQRAMSNIAEFANEGQDRMRTFAPAEQPAPPRQPATVIRAEKPEPEPQPIPQPPSFEPDLTTPAAIYEALTEIEQRNDQTRRMYAPQPGDRLNKQGEPFSNKAAAKIDLKRAGDGFAIVEAGKGFVVRPTEPVLALPPPDADIPALKQAWRKAVADGRTDDANAINERIVAAKRAQTVPQQPAESPAGPVVPNGNRGSEAQIDPAPAVVTGEVPSEKAAPKSLFKPGFDSEAWQKARDDRVKASRDAGNTHLDTLPAYVESMRGKTIRGVHDGKVTGKILTVDNRGNVYVEWSDAYSQEKEGAVPMQMGKRKVMQTSLGPRDLKDYVVAGEAASPTPAKPNRRTKAVQQKQAEVESKRADYFTPGNIVKSYGGHDEVVRYDPPDESGRWNVRVRAVVKQGDEWAPVQEAGRPAQARNHATQPDAKELAAGPVRRTATQQAAAAPEQQPAPAEQPKPAKREPRSFRKAQMVTTPVLVEETGRFESREVDADTALTALKADISELEAFLKCMKG